MSKRMMNLIEDKEEGEQIADTKLVQDIAAGTTNANPASCSSGRFGSILSVTSSHTLRRTIP